MGARSFGASTPPPPTDAPPETHVWSPLQEDIFAWFRKEGPHAFNRNLMVVAGAGTGKTTTIVEGVRQAPEHGVLLTAFNKSIADELNRRLDPSHATAKTLHGVGMRYVTREWPGIRVAKGLDRAKAVVGHIDKRLPWQIARLVAQLMTHAREATPLKSPSADYLVQLADDRGLTIPEGWQYRYDMDQIAVMAQAAYDFTCRHAPDRTVGIDFADMIFLPLRFKLLTPDYPLVVVDETQDMTEAQLALVLGVKEEEGRLCIVGDPNQCQPAGTKVQTANGLVDIADIRQGDTVISWDRHAQAFIKRATVTAVASRQYTGRMLRVGTPLGHQSLCTPNHKWLVRWTSKPEDVWITYLMRKGYSFRVGQCKMFRSACGLQSLGLHVRVNQELADEAWVLGVYGTREDAFIAERVISARYGIPELCFRSTNHTHFNDDTMSEIWTALGDLTHTATTCLADFGREIAYPFYRRANKRLGRQTLFETEACNLLPGFMDVPTAPHVHTGFDKPQRRTTHWTSISRVDVLTHSGLVYSMNVDTHHKYIADGLVTCNCIYSFRGADSQNMTRLERELRPAVLPLNVTYRCGKDIVAHANRLVPELYAHDTNPAGVVRRGANTADLLMEAKAGDFVLSRINAPLAGLCLSLLAQGTRACIKGRDISERILGILTKVGALPNYTIDQVRELVVMFQSKETTRYAAVGDLDRANAVRDNCSVLLTIMATCTTVSDLRAKCDYLFVRDETERGAAVLLSSIHKAKGLEADTVWLLEDTLYAWGVSQEERNLEYVAVTRAKSTLVLVTGLA